MSDVFSVSGTLNRGRYAMAVFLKILPLALIANAIVIGQYANSHAEVMAAIQAQDRAALGEFMRYVSKASGIIIFITVILGLNVAVKRLRNIGISGWWSLLLFVPFVQLFAFAYLLAAKGEDVDDYSYDDDSMPLGFKAIFALSLLSFGSVAFMYWMWMTRGVIWAQFGPHSLTGVSAASVYAALGILNGSIAYGVYRRKEWAYFAIMGMSLFEMVLSSANYFFVSKNPEIMAEYYRLMNIAEVPAHDAIVSSMGYSTGFAIFAGIAFIIYVNKNLNYFTE